MAQHFNICGLKVKYCQKVEESIRKKFALGIERVRRSNLFIEELNSGAKEHKDETIFYTNRIVGDERETLEVHFDERLKIVTQIFVIK